jgi:hypothetical protein
MKLLLEQFDNIESLVENTNEGKKLYIEGIFAQADKKNRNGRIYRKDILENQIEKFVNEKVKTNRALGNLDHPATPQVDPKEASHRITEMIWSGSDVNGKAIILNTPVGNIVRGLLEGGTQLGVSTRGAGSVRMINGINEVQKDYTMSTVDIVTNPSGIDCFVDALMESVDWVVENGMWKQIQIQEAQEAIKHASKNQLLEAKLSVFNKMMKKFC